MFTFREDWAIRLGVTGRLTVTDRLRSTLRRYLRDREFRKGDLAAACGRNASWVSMLLSGERGVKLDELDAMAEYFRVSLGELLGAAKPGELSGDEQRMVLAFRALPQVTKDHFLSVIEAASLGSSMIQNKQNRAGKTVRNLTDPTYKSASESFHAPGRQIPTAAGAADPATELARLRSVLTELALIASKAATISDTVPAAHAPKAGRGPVAS